MNGKSPDRVEQIKENISVKLARYFSATEQEATQEQMYKAVVMSVRDILTQKSSTFRERRRQQGAKRAYYMSIEFLIGPQLKNNLENLGLFEDYKLALRDMGFSLESIINEDPDPALGNGGLGRLAACFMDALTTEEYSVTGFSICYEYGFFKQRILDGVQIELPDEWLGKAESWLRLRSDKACTVKFGGHVTQGWENGRLVFKHEDYEEVQAVPYDLMVSGYNCEAVNILRLWRAQSPKNLNMNLFSQGQYVKALEEETNAEVISKMLYPSDNHTEGKLLRLSQQYFLASASVQTIISDHLKAYGTLDNFADKVAIHLNDTHPALCIPELIRILLDVYSYSWEKAWDTAKKVFSYTNHTVMPEALETWNEDLFRLRLPRIYMIIQEINKRFCADLWKICPDNWDRISRMSITAYSNVRMANLSVAASSKVNGVSKLHSEILKKSVFKDFYDYEPDKFTNVTNGIAHRRWLCYSNPGLAGLLDECIGTDYRKNPEQLANFRKYADDSAVLQRLGEIKHENKVKFAEIIAEKTNILVDPSSIFDVQVKRIHEYKRQLLCALRIIYMYSLLKNSPNADVTPQTFIFAGKAAPSYHMAKEIIHLICSISAELERTPQLRDKMRVIFLENYNVSLAENLIPAADISEQISLAGKEASGTSNMKFMINGALTVATLDGANIEMRDVMGEENMFLFGLDAQDVEELWRSGYNALSYYNSSEKIRTAVDMLGTGFAGQRFDFMKQYLISGNSSIADPYMCLADFDSYCSVHERVTALYSQKSRWNRKALMNIASAGYFAADRSVREYAENIWHIPEVQNK